MRIATLLLSHAAPAAIPLHAAYHEGIADLFVHVDPKVPQRNIPACPAANFIARRHIAWGGWSMLEVIFDLLAAAQAFGDHDLYLLLSDDCAPLLPPRDLVATLTPLQDRIRIATDLPEWCLQRYRDYHYFDHPALSPRQVEPHERVMDAALFGAVAEASNLWRTRGKKPVILGHGPTWWALTRDTVDFLIRQYRDDNWARLSFKYSANPDEQYIHTLIGRPSDAKFMFSDFSRPTKPFVFQDVAEIRATVPPGYLFVRKVNPAVTSLAELVRTGELPA